MQSGAIDGERGKVPQAEPPARNPRQCPQAEESMLTSLLKRTALTAVAVVALSTAAFAQLAELKIMAPAAPGGGWDGTARSMQQALTAAGIVKSVQVNNVTGAGGTIGLAQLIGAKGDGHQLMVSGFVMVGAILLN